MKTIKIGSRGVNYRSARGTGKPREGTGRVIDIYETRTGQWFVIKDATTGATVKMRGGEVYR